MIYITIIKQSIYFFYIIKLSMSFQNRKLLNSPYIPLGLSNLKSVPVFSEGSTSKLTQHFQS